MGSPKQGASNQRKYAVSEGRARRSEYWYFTLVNFIISFVLNVVDVVIGVHSSAAGLGILGGLYALAIFIPSLAVAVRRLHDTGRSGWWIFIGLIPVIGVIVLLIFMVTDSNSQVNAYGPSPKLMPI
jgi:uncharacterized membrane protein YhaH (DUF805 family)